MKLKQKSKLVHVFNNILDNLNIALLKLIKDQHIKREAFTNNFIQKYSPIEWIKRKPRNQPTVKMVKTKISAAESCLKNSSLINDQQLTLSERKYYIRFLMNHVNDTGKFPKDRINFDKLVTDNLDIDLTLNTGLVRPAKRRLAF